MVVLIDRNSSLLAFTARHNVGGASLRFFKGRNISKQSPEDSSPKKVINGEEDQM